MKMVFRLIIVFSVVALLAGFQCILNCSCKLGAESAAQRAKLVDNTKLPQKKSLTLLVYMAADNDLESHAIRNLKAMERADFSRMNVLVLLDRAEGYDETNDNWTDTRLFEVTHDNSNGSEIVSKRLDCPPLGLSKDSCTELDMGSFTVLKTFIEFAKTNFQAENYALIMWGHGTGWRASSRAVAIDDKSNSYICVKELGQALQNQGLSVVGFDTCFGSVFETLYELKDCVQFITASPGLTPASGWDYKTLLQALEQSDFSASAISQIMAENSNTQATVTPANELLVIMNALEDFSQALSSTITDEASRRTVLENFMQVKSYCYTDYPCDMYIDIFDMALKFSQNQNAILVNAAQQLKDKITPYNIGLLFIQKSTAGTFAASHSWAYIKNQQDMSQCSFIKESTWWVPTKEGNSGSILDKLFYTSF